MSLGSSSRSSLETHFVSELIDYYWRTEELLKRLKSWTLTIDTVFNYTAALGTASESTTNEKTAKDPLKAESEPGLFRLIPDELLNLQPTVSQSLFRERRVFNSETEVATKVTTLCEAILEGMPQCDLTVQFEKGINRHSSDLLIFSKAGRPVGFFEVKLAGHHETLTKPSIQGQVWAYLNDLMIFHSQPAILGVLTSFNSSRVCWLSSTTANQLAASNGVINVIPDYNRPQESFDSAKAKIITSEFVSCNSPTFIRTIASALFKMNNIREWRTSAPSGARIDSYQQCMYVSRYVPAEAPEDQVWGDTMRTCKQIVLLEKYQSGGGDGQVWRGCAIGPYKAPADPVAYTNLQCVIKYFHPVANESVSKEVFEHENKQRMEEEANKFNEVNPHLGGMARPKRLLQHALLMPLCTPLTNDEWELPCTIDAIQECLNRLVAARIAYRDVKRVHFAHFNEVPGIVLLDTCRVKLSASDEALQQMRDEFAAFLESITSSATNGSTNSSVPKAL